VLSSLLLFLSLLLLFVSFVLPPSLSCVFSCCPLTAIFVIALSLFSSSVLFVPFFVFVSSIFLSLFLLPGISCHFSFSFFSSISCSSCSFCCLPFMFFVIPSLVVVLVVSFLSSSSVDFVTVLCSCLVIVHAFFLLYTFLSGTMHQYLRIGESIFASSVPFVSMLNSTSIEEIIEPIVVLLFVLDLGLWLLFVSIVVHLWPLVCLSSCLLHIFTSYSFFLFLLEFSIDFFNLFTVLVDPIEFVVVLVIAFTITPA
jgi:hypothetical protein